MKALNSEEILSSFSAKERKLVKLPNLIQVEWNDLDFFGWIHPSGHLGYIVYELDHEMRGMVLEKTNTSSHKPKMCSICLTVHSGSHVNLFSAKSAKNKNRSLGLYMCHDLKCSLYVRCKKVPTNRNQMMETITRDKKIERLINGLERFMRKICI